MRKSKKHSLKSGAPAGAGRGKAKGLSLLLLVLLLGTLAVAGQQGGQVAKKDITDRFENAVKAKEPKFKLASKLARKNRQENYVMQGWKADEDFVSATTRELASAEEAAEQLKKSLDAPVSVPLQTTNLTRLGDEAFIRVNSDYGKGHTSLLFRKGNVLVSLTASSPGIAKRFAKHMADEIGN